LEVVVMLSAPLILALELPPLAFGPALPPPHQMPRELVCQVRELGVPAPPAPLRVPNLPRFATPKPNRAYLFGPKTDHLIYVLGILAASASGGNVDFRSPEQKNLEGTLPPFAR
jgi:hypothetical protein